MSILLSRGAALAALLVVTLGLSACAGGRIAETGPAMALGAPAAPPAAVLDYCTRMPAECGVDSASIQAKQTVARRYWKAVFAAANPQLKGGRINWAGIAQSIDEAPAAIHADANGEAGSSAMTADQFLNRHGGPALIAALNRTLAQGAAPPPAPTLHKLIWDTQTRRRVAEINQAVNAAITEQADIVTYGVEDYWAIPTLVGKDRFGDCEDYALMKRRDLIAAGVAPDALSIAIVKTQSNSMHAVLLVATDRGDFVLDNLDGAIRPWTETSYRWIERQVPGSVLAWVRAGGAFAPQASGKVELVAMGAKPVQAALAALAPMSWGKVGAARGLSAPSATALP
jgi:predicted transglutaminase-like cysteine proteinase